VTPAEAEAARIRAEFERRERELGRSFYALTTPANLFTRHGQERALLSALDAAKLIPLGERRILDVGCGRGEWLAVLEDFGAQRERISGIDLDAVRVEDCRRRFQGADLRVGDATKLPWESATFDVVLQSTVFTSILDGNVRKQVAAEMVRVLRPGGTIIWYDFRYDNPRNANVRGINARELKELFAACDVDVRSATLAPPIARWLVPKSWLIASGLERLRVLNTHCVAVIKPR
jgi:SAM-dependent methyltransferase